METEMMSIPSMLVLGVLFLAQVASQTTTPETSVVGYLRDSACVHRFHEVTKPLPNGCVEACVRGGSPLVILTKDQQVYHTVATTERLAASQVRSRTLSSTRALGATKDRCETLHGAQTDGQR